MRKKTLVIILVILIVGILAVVFINYRKKSSGSSLVSDFSLPKFNKDEVSLVSIKAGDSGFEIKKEAQGWQVGTKKADQTKVTDLLNSFDNLEVIGPVSTSGQNYSRFDLDEDKGVKLELKNSHGGILLSIIIGKSGREPGTTYFKAGDGKNVYMAKANWSYSVYKKENDWRDKTIWDLASDQAKKVVVKQGRKKYEADKNGDKWEISYGGKVKQAVNLESDLTSLKAVDFSSEEIKQPDLIIIYGEGEKELVNLKVGSDDSYYYLSPENGSEEKFKVSKYTFEKVWLPKLFEKAD